nr:uncharacterized protein LOC112936088 isoform X2 [Oryza sativa Japonica Group]
MVKYWTRKPGFVFFFWNGGSSWVAAIGYFFDSGKLMFESGHLVPWTGTLDCRFLLRSCCRITKGGIGGPLVDLDGNVLGMNFYDKKIGTPYLRWHVITLLKLTSVVTLEGPLPCYAGVYLPGWNGGDNANLNRVFDQTACTSKYCFVLPQSPPVAPDWTIETGGPCPCHIGVNLTIWRRKNPHVALRTCTHTWTESDCVTFRIIMSLFCSVEFLPPSDVFAGVTCAMSLKLIIQLCPLLVL